MANREKVEAVTDFIFLGSKITVNGTATPKLRPLLLGRKAITNLDSVLRNRDIILLPKVHIVEAMVFPVVMYGCESWTMKKAEPPKIDAFELWCWRNSQESTPWFRSNSSSVLSFLHGPALTSIHDYWKNHSFD